MKTSKPFQCQECGKRMSTKAAERGECSGCGGSDIDLANEEETPLTVIFDRNARDPFRFAKDETGGNQRYVEV